MIGRARTLAIVLIALLAFGSASALLATAEPAATDVLLDQPGLEAAYARSYVATSQTSECTCSYGTQEVTSAAAAANATVLQFDSDASAGEAFAALQAPGAAAGLMNAESVTADSFESVEVGDQAALAIVPAAGGDGFSGLIVALDGDRVYVVTANGPDALIRGPLVDFATHMAATEPGAGEVVTASRGGSTGGLFDLLPGMADASVLGGMLPTNDYDLLASTDPVA